MSHSPFIHTYTGGQFHYGNEKLADVRIEDIAHQLAHVCRFSGASKFHYSVAQHSLIVERMVRQQGASNRACLRALLHDAHEAYIGDFPTPFQVWFREEVCSGADFLEEAKMRLDNMIFKALGVDYDLPAKERALIHWADKAAFLVEANQLFDEIPTWLPEYAARYDIPSTFWEGETILPLRPEQAKNVFHSRFQMLWTDVFHTDGEAA